MATCDRCHVGVVSLRKRLRAAGGNEAMALRVFQGGTRQGYAAKVLRVARFVRAKGAK